MRTQPRVTKTGRRDVPGGEGRGEHRADAVGAAEDGFGFGAPGGALLGEGAGFVLGLPGLEVGLLRQRAGLDHGRGPVVLALERGRQFGLAVLDGRPPLRPAGVQRGVDADEFADRALAGVGGGPFGEPDGEGFGEAAFQGGVVDLGGGDDGLEQEASVDGEPASVEGLDLVRDGDVGVQVGVAGAAVAVGEPGGDQPGDVDLADAVVAGARVEGVGLDEPQRVADRGEVGAFDGGRGGGFGERPQGRDALDRGEGEVVAGDGGGLRAGRRGDQPGEFAGVDGVASEGGPEGLASDLGADRGADLRGDRRVVRGADLGVVGGEALGDLDPELGHVVGVDLERLAQPDRVAGLGDGGVRREGFAALSGEGVVARSEQEPHLLGGDHVAGVQALDAGHPGADPHARGLALLRVVGRQPGVALLGGVHRSHLPGQVLVPVPGGQLVQTHHTRLTGAPMPRRTASVDAFGRAWVASDAIGT